MTDPKKYVLGLHWGWVVLGASFITLFINYSIRIGAYPILLPEMIKDLHMTKTQAGIIKSAFSITYLLFAPLMGWLTDRIGGRRVISFFCLLLGGGAFLMGEAETFTTASIFFSIVGIGSAAMWVPAAALTQRWFGVRKRGLALGILNASAGAGFGMMGLFLPLIVMRYSWRVGWFSLGITGMILLLLNWLLLRDKPEGMGLSPWGVGGEEVGQGPTPSKKTGYREMMKESRFWIIGISYLAISYGSYSVLDFIVTYGTMELKISYPISSLFITIIAFSGVIGGMVLMILSDTIGRKKSLMIIYLLLSAIILFIIFVGNRILPLMIGIGGFGFLYGAIFPMVAACSRDYFPEEVAGTALGLLTIFYGLGAMLTPLLTGYMADVFGTFQWPFGVGAFASLFAGFLIGFLKRPKGLIFHVD